MTLENKMAEVIAEQLVKVALSGDSANRLLIGNLIVFLIKKGVIDESEYLQFTQETKDHLAANREPDGESDLNMVESIFDLHLNDLKKD